MHCPRCSGLVSKRFMRKINHPSSAILDICDNCNGMWIDSNEVKMLYGFSKNIIIKKLIIKKTKDKRVKQ